jgi:hypothetical protein
MRLPSYISIEDSHLPVMEKERLALGSGQPPAYQSRSSKIHFLTV